MTNDEKRPTVDEITINDGQDLIKSTLSQRFQESVDPTDVQTALKQLRYAYYHYQDLTRLQPKTELKRHLKILRHRLQAVLDCLTADVRRTEQLISLLSAIELRTNLKTHTARTISTYPKAPQTVDSFRTLKGSIDDVLSQTTLYLDVLSRNRTGDLDAAVFEAILDSRIGFNPFGAGTTPEAMLIAKDIYIAYQILFHAPTTWSNDLNANSTGGPAVRFAVKALQLLGITNPKDGTPYSHKQIVAIWAARHGRSNS